MVSWMMRIKNEINRIVRCNIMGEFICIPDVRKCIHNHYGVCEFEFECPLDVNYKGKR